MGCGCLHAEHDLDALAAQHLAERLAQRRRLAREHMVGPLHERHRAAAATYHVRQLEPGRPSAEHEQPFGHGLHAGRAVRAPDAL